MSYTYRRKHIALQFPKGPNPWHKYQSFCIHGKSWVQCCPAIQAPYNALYQHGFQMADRTCRYKYHNTLRGPGRQYSMSLERHYMSVYV